MNPSLVARVVDAVRHQWLVVACVLAIGTVAVAFALINSHPKYTATTTVLMVAEPPETSSGTATSTGTKPLLSMDLPSVVTAATVLARFREDMGGTSSFETLQRHIRARVSFDSSVMPVQYSDETAENAIRGANALSDEVVRFYRETATTRFDSLIADFNSQLARRRAELTQLDGRLAAAAKIYPYIDVAAPGTVANGTESVYQRLIAIRTERDTLRATIDAEAANARATSRLISNAEPLAERDVVNSDSTYRNVSDQYAKDVAEVKKLSAFGRDRYPGLDELRNTVAREAVIVSGARRQAASAGPGSNATYVSALDAQANANALFNSDRAKLRALENQLEQLQEQIGKGRIATDVARIRRDRDSSESAYATISERLAKTIADRAEAASTGSVIVMDRARFAPRDAFAGGTVIAIALVFLTLWLALTLAVMLDGKHEWFRDAQTIEAVYGAKLIGSIS
jgi:hypothetical protein